jgi:hypothetical protein
MIRSFAPPKVAFAGIGIVAATAAAAARIANHL